MMISLVLLAAWGCARNEAAQGPTQGSTATEPEYPPPCTNCDGWNAWVDELEAELNATGKCPTELPAMVAQADGTMVKADPYVVDTSGDSLSWGEYMTGAHTTSLRIFVRQEADIESCDPEAFPYDDEYYYFERPRLNSMGLRVSGFYLERHTTPAIFRTPPDDDEDRLDAFVYYRYFKSRSFDHKWYGGDGGRFPFIDMYVPEYDVGSYMWVCIESIDTPDDFEVGPGTWRGSLFIHGVWWQNKDNTWYKGDDPPTDIFVRLGDMDCTSREECTVLGNQRWPENTRWKGQYPPFNYWTADCDGLDNDMDGQVDEGRAAHPPLLR